MVSFNVSKEILTFRRKIFRLLLLVKVKVSNFRKTPELGPPSCPPETKEQWTGIYMSPCPPGPTSMRTDTSEKKSHLSS